MTLLVIVSLCNVVVYDRNPYGYSFLHVKLHIVCEYCLLPLFSCLHMTQGSLPNSEEPKRAWMIASYQATYCS
jgi:hypothetical protein